MELIQARTPKGSITNCSYIIDDNGNKYCMSYGQKVASIINGQYKEYDGDRYYSQTSNRHKKQFKRYFGLI